MMHVWHALQVYTVWYWALWMKTGHWLLAHPVRTVLMLVLGYIVYSIVAFVRWVNSIPAEDMGEW